MKGRKAVEGEGERIKKNTCIKKIFWYFKQQANFKNNFE